MTDQQINAAIAEACGWAHSNIEPHAYPNYCNDLNAMHEAENHLGESTNMVEYTNALYDMACLAQSLTNRWNPYGLPARYRAEAFLRTLGKWEEATDKDCLTVQAATTEESSVIQKEVQK
jgi:hypothetical protein